MVIPPAVIINMINGVIDGVFGPEGNDITDRIAVVDRDTPDGLCQFCGEMLNDDDICPVCQAAPEMSVQDWIKNGGLQRI